MDAVRQGYQREYSPDQRGLAVDENFSEAMSNSIIGSLRAKYLDLINREADWSARYGASHVAVVNLRNQIRDIRRSIYDELGRIEETAKSEVEIAKRRQNEMETALTTAVTKTQDTSQAQVTLFSLEAAAKSYRSLYDSFLRAAHRVRPGADLSDQRCAFDLVGVGHADGPAKDEGSG